MAMVITRIAPPTRLEMFIRELQEALRDEGECLEEVTDAIVNCKRVELKELKEVPKGCFVYTSASVYSYDEGWGVGIPRNP